MNWYVAGASFLGTAVEFVEALTIVLAVLLTKGWKTAFAGAALAVVVLVALVLIVGYPLIHAVQLPVVQFIVGLLMLLFGMRWLRKAILRYTGYKAVHDEGKAFAEELEKQKGRGSKASGIDGFGALTAFNGVFLEGLESVFIVITVGLSAHSLAAAVWGSVVALVLVVLAGVAFRSPLQAVPENTLKFVVGVLLSSFGTFWAGEGLGVAWFDQDVSILVVAGFFLVASLLYVAWLRALRRKALMSESRSMSS
ncbi:MAG: hypothetical protein OWU32_07395 [Firmicutes bacterium]|nr:hypothetical protein [Bacillota bacterium]